MVGTTHPYRTVLALRRPDWRNVSREHVTDEQLAKMDTEAREIDAANAEGLAAVQAAMDEYVSAYTSFFGRSPEGYKRRGYGVTYVARPALPFRYGAAALEEFKRQVEHARKEAERKRLAREQQAKADEERRKADVALAILIVRYGAPEESTWDDMLELLRGKNKYLDLAVAGMQTRSDWSEGFYRVSDAMSRFKIEDDRDKEIVTDLFGCMGSDDGRVFRDTAWSYDALLELVEDKQLVEDVKQCVYHN